MAPYRLLSAASLLLAGAVAAACQSTAGPTLPGARDAMGRPAPGPVSDRSWEGTRGGGEIGRPDAQPQLRDWQWIVDAGALAGTVELPGTSLAQGLRVSVSASSALTGLAASHDLVEGNPAAILVGYGDWPAGASPATADAQWTGARVRVEWLVSLHGRSSCSVDLEAVPRVVLTAGCSALLEEFRLRRTLELGESLVISTDPSHRPTAAALAIVGANGAAGGRFVVRVRP